MRLRRPPLERRQRRTWGQALLRQAALALEIWHGRSRTRGRGRRRNEGGGAEGLEARAKAEDGAELVPEQGCSTGMALARAAHGKKARRHRRQGLGAGTTRSEAGETRARLVPGRIRVDVTPWCGGHGVSWCSTRKREGDREERGHGRGKWKEGKVRRRRGTPLVPGVHGGGASALAKIL